MDVLFRECSKNDGLCIKTPDDILGAIPYRITFEKEQLAPTMESLKLDGYIDFEEAVRKGEPVYCVELKKLGEGYEREKKVDKLKLYKKIAIAVAVAILGVIIKQIVSAII